MKMSTFLRHTKEASQNVLRNGWMSVAAITAVTVTLLLLGTFISILVNANKFAYDVENNVSIRVYIDLAASEAEVDELEQELIALEGVENVEFSSRDQELEQVIGSYGEEFSLFEGDDNPLLDVFVVNTTEPDLTAKVADDISELTYVSKVNYGGASADRLFELVDNVRIVGIVAVAVLFITAFFLIANTIRVTIFSRSREIEIMKLVGATNWFIRWPYIYEGALLGMIGGLIPAGIIAFGYRAVFGRLLNMLSGTSIDLISPNPFVIYLGIGLVVAGISIGSIASMFSIRRFLKV